MNLDRAVMISDFQHTTIIVAWRICKNHITATHFANSNNDNAISQMHLSNFVHCVLWLLFGKLIALKIEVWGGGESPTTIVHMHTKTKLEMETKQELREMEIIKGAVCYLHDIIIDV